MKNGRLKGLHVLFGSAMVLLCALKSEVWGEPMVVEALERLSSTLAESGPSVGHVQEIIGAKTSEYRPPNQYILSGFGGSTLDRAEVLLKEESAESSVNKVNLIYDPTEDLLLSDLVSVFGTWEVVNEDRPAAPASLVAFDAVGRGSQPMKLIITARVEGPPEASSKVFSVQLNRLDHLRR